MDKKTVLYDEHIKLNAKMVPFGGWQMPVSYKGILEEHKNVRENVGLFDVSHMGEFFVTGKDALSFLQTLVPQDVSKLELNKAVYCQLTNEKGGVIDDLIIYKLGDENYLLIVNASRISEDFEHISANKKDFDVNIENKSDDYALLALQGPHAKKIIDQMGLKEELQPSYFSILKTKLLDVDTYVSRTGYTGEDGFEIMVENKYAAQFWNKILELGAKYSIEPIGLGARDTLRLEAGLHLWGNDLDEATTPIEAGLLWSIPKDKKENYTGRDVIMGQVTGEKPKTKKLIAFEMADKAIARHGYEIYFEDKKTGFVTSGGISPTSGKYIGLGYVDLSNISLTFLNKTPFPIGTEVQVMVRNKLYNAKVVKRPFVQKNVIAQDRSK